MYIYIYVLTGGAKTGPDLAVPIGGDAEPRRIVFRAGEGGPVYVYMYVYMYIRIYIYVYIHTHAHTYTYIYIHTHMTVTVYMYVYIYIYISRYIKRER